jgi:hypothetical protein
LPEQSYYADSEIRGEITSQDGDAGLRKTNSYIEASPNVDLRTREYLTEAEVERLLSASKGNR